MILEGFVAASYNAAYNSALRQLHLGSLHNLLHMLLVLHNWWLLVLHNWWLLVLQHMSMLLVVHMQ